jgi:hypothetical protein
MTTMTSHAAPRCPTCEAIPTGRPTYHLGLAFCCDGCAADGPCTCSYDPDDADEPDPMARIDERHGAVSDAARVLIGAGR